MPVPPHRRVILLRPPHRVRRSRQLRPDLEDRFGRQGHGRGRVETGQRSRAGRRDSAEGGNIFVCRKLFFGQPRKHLGGPRG